MWAVAARTCSRSTCAPRSINGSTSRASATSGSRSRNTVAIEQPPRILRFDLEHDIVGQALGVQLRELLGALAQRRVGAEQKLRSVDELQRRLHAGGVHAQGGVVVQAAQVVENASRRHRCE